MGILFITSSRIGDAILSTGILNHLMSEYPEERFSVACGPLVTGFFEENDRVDAVFPLKKQSFSRHWVKLWPKIAGKRWKMVVDLRNSAVSRLVLAKKTVFFGSHIDKSLHKVEQNAAVLGLNPDQAPHPQLWFRRETLEQARDMLGRDERPIIAIGPAANWAAKTWPLDRFIAVMNWLTQADGPFPDARVAIIAAPGEEAQAMPVLQAVPEDRCIDLIAKGSPVQASACLSLCDFYLGNDSGLMHAAAACGVPTFGMFGPSWPHLYAPYGPHTAYAQTEKDFSALIDYPGYVAEEATCLMEDLSVDAVKNGIEAFLNR